MLSNLTNFVQLSEWPTWDPDAGSPATKLMLLNCSKLLSMLNAIET